MVAAETTDMMRANRKNWREVDLHGLRVLYACLLSDIASHRWAIKAGTGDEAADQRLWDILDRELR